jgi:hypothetical protein
VLPEKIITPKPTTKSIDMNEEKPNEIDLRMSKLKEVSSKSNGKTLLTLPGSNAIEYSSNIKGFIIRRLGRIVSISNDDMNSLIKMTDDDMGSYITKRFQGDERKQEILKEFIRIVIDGKEKP